MAMKDAVRNNTSRYVLAAIKSKAKTLPHIKKAIAREFPQYLCNGWELRRKIQSGDITIHEDGIIIWGEEMKKSDSKSRVIKHLIISGDLD